VREAFLMEVTVYFANIAIFALQMLHFSSSHGTFEEDEGASEIVLPVAGVTKIMVLDFLGQIPTTAFPWWRTLVFLLVCLSVLFSPSVLRIYYDADIKQEQDVGDHANKNRQWWRKLRCYVFSYVFYSLLMIPTFREFAVALSCNSDPDHRYSGDHVCFGGAHLVMVVFFCPLGFVYLVCALLFETVNFNLSSLLESKIGSKAAFPRKKSNGREEADGGKSKDMVKRRNITLPRLFYVMFRQLIPGHHLEPPQENVGIFTETKKAGLSRQVRFVSKVLLAALSKMGPEVVEPVMWAMACIALVNLLVNLVFPPLIDRRLMGFIIFIQACALGGTVIAVSALVVPPVNSSAIIHATVYMLVIVVAPCLCICGASCLFAARSRHELKLQRRVHVEEVNSPR